MSNQLEDVPGALPKCYLNVTTFELLGNVLLKYRKNKKIKFLKCAENAK
jgi:hypothetical protein